MISLLSIIFWFGWFRVVILERIFAYAENQITHHMKFRVIHAFWGTTFTGLFQRVGWDGISYYFYFPNYVYTYKWDWYTTYAFVCMVWICSFDRLAYMGGVLGELMQFQDRFLQICFHTGLNLELPGLIKLLHGCTNSRWMLLLLNGISPWELFWLSCMVGAFFLLHRLTLRGWATGQHPRFCFSTATGQLLHVGLIQHTWKLIPVVKRSKWCSPSSLYSVTGLSQLILDSYCWLNGLNQLPCWLLGLNKLHLHPFGLNQLFCGLIGLNQLHCWLFGLNELHIHPFGLNKLICGLIGLILLLCWLNEPNKIYNQPFGLNQLMCGLIELILLLCWLNGLNKIHNQPFGLKQQNYGLIGLNLVKMGCWLNEGAAAVWMLYGKATTGFGCMDLLLRFLAVWSCWGWLKTAAGVSCLDLLLLFIAVWLLNAYYHRFNLAAAEWVHYFHSLILFGLPKIAHVSCMGWKASFYRFGLTAAVWLNLEGLLLWKAEFDNCMARFILGAGCCHLQPNRASAFCLKATKIMHLVWLNCNCMGWTILRAVYYHLQPSSVSVITWILSTVLWLNGYWLYGLDSAEWLLAEWVGQCRLLLDLGVSATKMNKGCSPSLVLCWLLLLLSANFAFWYCSSCMDLKYGAAARFSCMELLLLRIGGCVFCRLQNIVEPKFLGLKMLLIETAEWKCCMELMLLLNSCNKKLVLSTEGYCCCCLEMLNENATAVCYMELQLLLFAVCCMRAVYMPDWKQQKVLSYYVNLDYTANSGSWKTHLETVTAVSGWLLWSLQIETKRNGHGLLSAELINNFYAMYVIQANIADRFRMVVNLRIGCLVSYFWSPKPVLGDDRGVCPPIVV